MTDSPKDGRIAALDGLRGVAVLLVLFVHFGFGFASGDTPRIVQGIQSCGWIGVDLFFVLSGYLITGGLIKSSPFGFGKRLRLFWTRRALRILPLYYIVLIAGSLFSLAIGVPNGVPSASYWVHLENYTLAFDHQFDRWTAHFWSLAIEEQFYFFWPFLVLPLGKRQRASMTAALIVLCICSRAIFMHYGTHLFGWPEMFLPKMAYRATPLRMDGLLMGALLAILEQHDDQRWQRLIRKVRGPIFVVGLATLLYVCAAVGHISPTEPASYVAYPLLAVWFSAAVSLATEDGFPRSIQRFLTNGPLAACGRVSYGMYIIHWPIVANLFRIQLQLSKGMSRPGRVVLWLVVEVLGALGTFGLAWLSYRFIEAPFLRLKNRFHD